MNRIDHIFDSPAGTPEGDELDLLPTPSRSIRSRTLPSLDHTVEATLAVARPLSQSPRDQRQGREMAQATPSTGVCPGPRRGGGESSPFCGAKGGRGAQRRRGFIRPKHRRTCSATTSLSLSPQRRGRGSNPPLCKRTLRGVLQGMSAAAQAIESPHARTTRLHRHSILRTSRNGCRRR